MRLSTFNGAENGFLKNFFLGVLLLSSLSGERAIHILGSYDLDDDDQIDFVILNRGASSIIWVEIAKSGVQEVKWTYQLPDGQQFNDAVVSDINSDGFVDLVAIIDLFPAIDDQPWIYVFLGSPTGFSMNPLTLGHMSLGLNAVRPSNISLVPGDEKQFVVAFGSPLRQGMVFNIDLVDGDIILKNTKMLLAPIISNGYGLVYTGAFKSNGGYFVVTIAFENKQLKVAIFDIVQNYKLIQSGILNIENAIYPLGADIQAFKSKWSEKNGLLIPFGSDDVFLLEIIGESLELNNTNLSGKGLFQLPDPYDAQSLVSILQKRIDAEIISSPPISKFISSEIEKGYLAPPPALVMDEVSTLKSVPILYDQDLTTLPDDQRKILYEETDETESKAKYHSLTPTLGDYLASVDKTSTEETLYFEKEAVPVMNKDMESVTWADEAGFTRINLGEYTPDTTGLDSIVSPIPEKDTGITTFQQSVQEAIAPRAVSQDTVLDMQSDDEIDLYYVLAMTPASETKDRYIFDGQAPFGVSVNQVPPMGKATHFQHGISANLANLERGETFDFAYSLRDARLDSITTLMMVHDMQTNVVFMSISPTSDSLSQAYQPEAFDPKLFEFPDYFFEGFPTSLDMDFTDKLIRFSFDGLEDSTYHGIYLSSTTPSNPAQSLAVFMDEGTLQAIRGEIVVRANGSKKVTTEFDLVGKVEPAVMFSRLIQEMFPNELKIKLLQGASLEEPLFGPSGKLPKVTREPRLPDAQPAQANPEIPVEPKQSNVPIERSIMNDEKITKESNTPIPQENAREPDVLEVEKQVLESKPSASDSLKLEDRKEPLKQLNSHPATPEEPQSKPELDNQSIKRDDENGKNP